MSRGAIIVDTRLDLIELEEDKSDLTSNYARNEYEPALS